jgi:hypothetical protein
MKFFMPGVKDDKTAENLYSGIRKFVFQKIDFELTDRRFFSLDYLHDGKHYVAQVGQHSSMTGEMVVAIFESNDLYLVCTPTRCVFRGEPILVGKHAVTSITDFD